MQKFLLASFLTAASAFRVRHKSNSSALFDPNYDCNGDGANECHDWDYGGARCANEHWCKYRYKFGDVLLDQSCRCKREYGRPTEYDCDGDGNKDCESWNYGRATCNHGHKCGYSYRFGDSLLDHSCRCKAECLGANLRACEDSATPPPTPAPTPYPTLAPTPVGGCGYLADLARQAVNYALAAALRGKSPLNVSLYAGRKEIDLWMCSLGLDIDASVMLSGFEDASIEEIDCGTYSDDSVTFGARLSLGSRVETAGAVHSNWSVCGLDYPNETGISMGVITEEPGLYTRIRLDKTSIPLVWKIGAIEAFDIQLGNLERFTCGFSGLPDFIGSRLEQWCVSIITWLADRIADYLDREKMMDIFQSLIDHIIEEPQDGQQTQQIEVPKTLALPKPRSSKQEPVSRIAAPHAVGGPKPQQCGALGEVARQAVNAGLRSALSGKSPLAVSLHAGQYDINLWGCTIGLEIDAGMMLSGFEDAQLESMDCESGGEDSMTFSARMSFGQRVEAAGAIQSNWSICGLDYPNETAVRMGVVTADPGLRLSMRLAKTSIPYIWRIAAIEAFEIQMGGNTAFTCGLSGVPDFIGSRFEAWCVSIIEWIAGKTADYLDGDTAQIFQTMIDNQIEEPH